MKLRSMLTEDLNIYTVVVMARRDLDRGDFKSAINRLKIDADKIRIDNYELYEFINDN
jgi:hypothetical protein